MDNLFEPEMGVTTKGEVTVKALNEVVKEGRCVRWVHFQESHFGGR